MARGHSREAFLATATAFLQELGDKAGLLTVTFAQNVECAKEAQRRWHSWNTGVLRRIFGGKMIKSVERQKRGAFHWHVLVCLPDDCNPATVDWEAYHKMRAAASKKDWDNVGRWGGRLRRSLPPWLCDLQDLIRESAQAYHFGRVELMPCQRHGVEVGLYISKHFAKQRRDPRDKGVRYWSASGGVARPLKASDRFSILADDELRKLCQGWYLVRGTNPQKLYGYHWPEVVLDWGIRSDIRTGDRTTAEVHCHGDGLWRIVRWGAFRYIWDGKHWNQPNGTLAPMRFVLDLSKEARRYWFPIGSATVEQILATWPAGPGRLFRRPASV